MFFADLFFVLIRRNNHAFINCINLSSFRLRNAQKQQTVVQNNVAVVDDPDTAAYDCSTDENDDDNGDEVTGTDQTQAGTYSRFSMF